jgi:outer membrane biosynthesis protein TonB
MLVARLCSYLSFLVASPRRSAVGCCAALALSFFALAQQPAQPTSAGAVQTPDAPQAQSAPSQAAGGISEEELRQLLAGKTLFLRGGYLENNISFDEYGHLIGHSPQGSYTLSAIQIDKVRLTKHKVELEGIRYGLHFVGQLAYEDPSKAVERVRITPKKKVVRISIDREIVVKPKKVKGKGKNKNAKAVEEPASTPQMQVDSGRSVTTSPAHATKLLKDALDQIFAQGFDERMMTAMPDFWRLYYQAVAARIDYQPQDPAILRQSTVDQKARLLTTFEPESNEFAQANGVAGMALYHTVVGIDGKAQEVAVGRPIGFGLDENAVAAIRKASFQPAVKDGKPVPVLLDLVVQFRIFSKRTAEPGQSEATEKSVAPVLPGPYSVQHP